MREDTNSTMNEADSSRPLTANGELRITNSAARLIGPDTLIQPVHIRQIIVSPRQRALRTLQLLGLPGDIPVQQTESICEWDYGDYEGLTSLEIDKICGKTWNVFFDGCPNGDGQISVTARIDKLIINIRERHAHAEACGERSDVLIVAHGHILRAFAARWIGDPVTHGARFVYGAGGAVSVFERLSVQS